MKRVVVVGGGISGLAAAHRLSELSRERKLGLAVTLLEASSRLGGLVDTETTTSGFVMERGADAFLTERPWALDLCRRLGLEPELMPTHAEGRRSFLMHQGKMLPVPEGFYLVAPAKLAALWNAPALDWAGKLRLAMEPFVPQRLDEGDESAADFIRRRFGAQVMERIGRPLLGGIYAGDVTRLSAQAALPRLCDLERRYGSVLRGLRSAGMNGNGAVGKSAGARYGLFMSLKGGMVRLVEALAANLCGVSVRIATPVASVIRQGAGWSILPERGHPMEAEHVVLALPAHRASRLLQAESPELAGELSSIEYESVAIVNMAFPPEDLAGPLAGFGFVVADKQNPVVGCTFSSAKFAGRAPAGWALVRCFLGGAMHREVERVDDRALLALAMEPLRKGTAIKGQPRLLSIRRWEKAMPQYHVGHQERVSAIERLERELPGLHLAGNAYRGLGIPDCVHQAEQAAEEIGEHV